MKFSLAIATAAFWLVMAGVASAGGGGDKWACHNLM
jgi:hypothetical protein